MHSKEVLIQLFKMLSQVAILMRWVSSWHIDPQIKDAVLSLLSPEGLMQVLLYLLDKIGLPTEVAGVPLLISVTAL